MSRAPKLKHKLSRGEYFRVEAIKAASKALQDERFGTQDVWALAVFYERYMWFGAKGTRKHFGPPKPKKAKVLKLVQSNGPNN